MKSGLKRFLISLFVFAGCIFSVFAGCFVNTKETPLQWMSSIKRGTLSNGMDYFILKNSQPQNRISLRLVVKAGSAMEEEDQKGVAHFVEHMCFNGTKSFEKNSIIQYFESIGMGFGPDLNAYTTFEETVYMLEIPADNPEIIKKSFQILKEWANDVTFEQTELDKERAVVNEEWRLRSGLNGRYSEEVIKSLYDGSQFAKRLPIGDMKIINTISRQRVIDFYKKWYRPEFMAVVAVGDIDPAVMEKAIKETLGTIPASDKTVTLPGFIVSSNSTKKVKFFKDKEMPYNQIAIFSRDENYKPEVNEKQRHENFALQIFSMIFNQRLSEKTNSVDSPWLGSSVSSLNQTRNENYNCVTIVPKTGKDIDCLKAVIDEYERFIAFGATEEEISRCKKAVIETAALNLKNKDKNESSNWASSIVWGFLNNAPVYGIVKESAYVKKYVNQITNDDLKLVAKRAFRNRGELLFIASPVNSTTVPSEKQLLDVWNNYTNTEISAYTENQVITKLMDKPSVKGKITSTVKNTKLGTTEYTFENGIKVITKKTKNVKNTITINALSRYGSNYVSDKDFPSIQIMFNYALLSGLGDLNYTQLQKILTDKQISFNTNFAPELNSMNLSTSKKDTETAFQLMNLMFTKLRFTDEGWKILMDTVNQVAKSHGSQVNDVFQDKIKELLFGNNIRYAPFDMNYVSKIDAKTAERICRDVYKDPSDYTYFVVGDFDDKSLIDLFAYYLGSLPTEKNPKVKKHLPVGFKGKKEATVKKGISKQGMINLYFYGQTDIEDYYTEERILNAVANLLEIRLRELIREEKGGSYSVSVDYNLNGDKDCEYLFEISFGCDPAREKELKNAAIAEIEQLKKEPVSDDYIQKIKESLKRNRETDLKENNWIIYILKTYYFNQTCPEDILLKDDFTDTITAEMLQKAISKYFNMNNNSTVYLVPEK